MLSIVIMLLLKFSRVLVAGSCMNVCYGRKRRVDDFGIVTITSSIMGDFSCYF
ncbi:hypothetical protein Vi05172_g8401 [Venturia inaequalis]|nr:hypothetical protein Vi05172_g8401 [Venturia inaequalis]